MQGLQADEVSAAVLGGQGGEMAGLVGVGAQRPFAINGFAGRQDLFQQGLVLRQIDGNHQQIHVAAYC